MPQPDVRAPAAAVQLRLPGRGGPGAELGDGRTRAKSPGGSELGRTSPLCARLGLARPRGLRSVRGTAATVRVSAGRGGCGGSEGRPVAEARPRMRLPLALLALAALGAAGAGREAAEEARAGRFSTPEQHRCRWELRSAAGASELRLSCRAEGGGAERSCAYRGEPRLCPAFGARSRQYWRQILSRLRRRHRPCAPGAPLSARLCGPGRAPPEAQLRLMAEPDPDPDPGPGPATPAPAEPTEDPAQTYCAERWNSLCSFFVSFWEG